MSALLPLMPSPLVPDADRARRVRSRCLARLERDRRRSARMTTVAVFGRRVVAPAFAAVLCAAYALAHHAWARGDQKPTWLKYLDGEGAHWCRASLRFLYRTGDTDFSPLGFEPLT